MSVVIPLFNEDGNVSDLVEQLVDTLSNDKYNLEIILVDDGSTDNTWQEIRALSTKESAVTGYHLSRNFGHQAALLAGLNQARGDAVVSMDGDLQHPPEVVPALLRAWEQGSDIVNTRRIYPSDTGFFKQMTSRGFYRVFSMLAEVDVYEGSSDFRLLSRRALDALLEFREIDLFLRGSVQWLGFNSATIEFEAGSRVAGVTSYTPAKMVRFATGAIISFSDKPLRIGVWVGIFTGLAAFLELAYIVVQFALGNTVPGWASTVGVLSLLFGVLFVLIGIIGMYIARIHRALQHRPTFILADMARDGIQKPGIPPIGEVSGSASDES